MLALVLCCCPPRPARAAPPALESLFAPARVQVLLSPHGDAAAVVRDQGLCLKDLPDGPLRPVPDLEGELSCAWSGPAELACAVRKGKAKPRAVFVDARQGRVARSVDLPGAEALMLAGAPGAPGRAVFLVRPPGKGVHDVYAVAPDGPPGLVEGNPGRVVRWLADPSGQVLGAVKADSTGRTLMLRSAPKSPWREVRRWGVFEPFEPLAVEPGGAVAALDLAGNDTVAACRLDPATGACAEVLGRFPGWDAARLVVDGQGRAAAVAGSGPRLEHVFLDKGLEKTVAALKAKHSEADVHVLDMADTGAVLALLSGPDEPGRYLFFDPASGRAEEVARVLPRVDRAALGRGEVVSFTASDGLVLPGYLILPKGAGRKGLPLAALVHDGPFGTRDHWRFDPMAQALAARGAAVLKLNVRGSGGLGRNFERAGYGQVGLAVARDVAEALGSLADSGLAAPGRLAAVGAGFGGYLAVRLAVSRPGLLACAAGFNAPLNLLTVFEEMPEFFSPGRKRLVQILGDPAKDFAALVEASPAFFPERASCPVFLAVNGSRYPDRLLEARRFARALEKRDVPAELADTTSQKDRLEAIRKALNFLATHLPLDQP